MNLARGGGVDDAPEGRHEGTLARNEQIDDDEERKDQKPPFPQHVPDAGQVLPGQAHESAFLRLQVDHGSNGKEVKQGRNDGTGCDLDVGNPQELGHDEGRRPHDGGHDLAACGGGGFHGSREDRAIAHLLHQGNREGARRHRVGHGRAADGAHEAAGDDGDLRRPPGGPAGQRHGEVHEELGEARPGDEEPEEDEVEDEGGHDPQGDAVDALGAEEHVVDDPRDGVAAVGEDVEARDVEEVGPEVAVDQHQHGDDRKRCADASPRPLQDEQEGEAPDDELRVVGASGPHADVVELEEDEDGDHAGHEREEEVEVGYVVQFVVDGFVPDEGIDRPDPVEDEQAP